MLKISDEKLQEGWAVGGTWRWLFMFQIVRPLTPIASIVCFTAVSLASKELKMRITQQKEQIMNCWILYAQSSRNQTIGTSLMRYSFHEDPMEIIGPTK